MDIFTTALGLSKQENGYELTSFLIGKLYSQFDPGEAAIFEVYGLTENSAQNKKNNPGQFAIRRFSFTDDMNRQQTNGAGFIEAIHTGKPLVVQDDNAIEHIAIPVKSKNGPLRLIVISGISQSPERRMELFQMVELYAGMIALHDSHERDQLTGLLNRHTFDKYFKRTISSINAPDVKMYLAILDIDHFKRVNDTFGHLVGDQVLMQFAKIMENNFRYHDALFRFGGEEFIALIKCDSKHSAEIALNRLRNTVENTHFPIVGNITVSTGLIHCDPEIPVSSLIGMADTALYYAKQHGRNQVIDYDDIRQEEDLPQLQM